MSKILRRLTGKDEENQDLQDKEADMSEQKYSKPLKKDIDFDLGDIAGEVAQKQEVSAHLHLLRSQIHLRL